MAAEAAAAAPGEMEPPRSWDSIRNWDKAPDHPPPPAGRARGPLPLPEDCADPNCADPLCGPMRKRMKEQPRADDMSDPGVVQLQEAMLSMAKDNRADEIRQMCVQHGLTARYGNSIGQTALHIAGVWNATEAAEALLEHGAQIDATNDLSGATREPSVLSCRRHLAPAPLTPHVRRCSVDDGRDARPAGDVRVAGAAGGRPHHQGRHGAHRRGHVRGRGAGGAAAKSGRRGRGRGGLLRRCVTEAAGRAMPATPAASIQQQRGSVCTHHEPFGLGGCGKHFALDLLDRTG